MSLDNGATINVDNLAFYAAVLGTTPPDLGPAALEAWDLENPDGEAGLEWVCLGHTSEGTNVTLSPQSEGGDRLGSLQRSSLRRSPRFVSWQFAVAFLQWDVNTLPKIFGGGDAAIDGEYGIPKKFTTQISAAVVVFGDSEANIGFHVPKVDYFPDGDIELGPSLLTENSLIVGFLDDDASIDLGRIYRSTLQEGS